jgi:nucleotide-binding universal stress UspA family protein
LLGLSKALLSVFCRDKQTEKLTMSYKTILLHVEESKHLVARVDLANKIAISENAHLAGVAFTGVSRFMPGSIDLHQLDPAMLPYLDTLRQRADRALGIFDEMEQKAGVLSYEKRLVDDDAINGMSLYARYCDLAIVGQDDLENPASVMTTGLPEYVALSGGSPTLIVPYIGTFHTCGERILIAWNASSHAMHAVRGSLPFLRRAKNVDVIVYNSAESKDVYGDEPGADIALYLTRHGVNVNVIQEEISSEIDVGNAILSFAASQGTDLIVMGCYGHSRFREILLGGATRVILESMTIPVLMAH